MAGNTINDTCPHCGEDISHELKDFTDGSTGYTCGSCGKNHYCVQYSPYDRFSIFVLSKEPMAADTRTLERFPSPDELEDDEE